MDTPSTNGREASAASTSQPASMNANTMKELKAKWQQSVKELNENMALAQALMASPKVTQVKPKVSASDRLPVIKMPEDNVPKPRTSLLGSGSIRYMFKAHGGPDPPKPPPSPFEAYAFADFTVPMPKVIQEVERVSQTGRMSSAQRSSVKSKMQEVPEDKTLPSPPNHAQGTKSPQTPDTYNNKSGHGRVSATDPAKVIISNPKQSPFPPQEVAVVAVKKTAPRGFCSCFQPQVSE